MTRHLNWHSAACTHGGKIRDCNEDAYFNHSPAGLWAVADGLGGYRNGDLASRMVVESLTGQAEATSDPATSLEQRQLALHRALERVNRHLGCEKTLHGSQAIGSTVAALLLSPQGNAACLWAGDSRCYLLRRRRLYQITRDHSLVQRLIEQRRISRRQAVGHPQSHVLTRAIGGAPELALETVELELERGDRLLLCTDGLYRDLSEEQMVAGLCLDTPGAAVTHLATEVLRGPATDNLTALAVFVS
ncbi:serine/threonine-protein phosphatase [Oceanimonas sp. CHS3-5]|uniref:PP2C family protein-serine/threonine phosphatase n=1 Tax=Oceanimonas sp. CHS3-5 TaxID=3068186 RepID=UPI00273EC2B2|nr:PP2C family serine/threonine-protein phosphatase [Oceanimonas sp. CHS3-5]MDP5291700.1 serine/threonine-protein phosphatase [Oceanimonas sp. CHS3-5]